MAKPEQGLATMVANLKEKTGKSLEQWVAIVRKAGFVKHGEIVKWLKGEHSLGHGYANLVALESLKTADAPAGDELIEAQYTGAKAGLRPIYEAVIAAAKSLGPDVEISPKKAYVSLRRSKQFALVQPSTAARIDVGINLKGLQPSGRLEASGSFNAMVSHRVRLESKADVNAELKSWLRLAYEQA